MEERDYWHSNHHHGGIGALILISLGTFLLLNNFGLLTPDSWTLLFKLWPVLLILAGIQMIFGRGRATSLLITSIGIIILVVLISLLLAPNNPSVNGFINQYLPFLKSVPSY